jgi:hypothetical protein
MSTGLINRDDWLTNRTKDITLGILGMSSLRSQSDESPASCRVSTHLTSSQKLKINVEERICDRKESSGAKRKTPEPTHTRQQHSHSGNLLVGEQTRIPSANIMRLMSQEEETNHKGNTPEATHTTQQTSQSPLCPIVAVM